MYDPGGLYCDCPSVEPNLKGFRDVESQSFFSSRLCFLSWFLLRCILS